MSMIPKLSLWIVVGGFVITSCVHSMEQPTKKAKTQDMATANGQLLEAAAAGDVEKVLEALTNHADINATDLAGATSLVLAASYGYQELVRLLLDRGASLHNAATPSTVTPLHAAIFRGHPTIVSLLLDRGFPINAASQGGVTPLLLAANCGNEALVKLLLDRGADTNAPDQHGCTPLHIAAGNGNETLVRLLLDKGAYINSVDTTNGVTPLCCATLRGHFHTIKMLLSHAHININAQATHHNTTPLSLDFLTNRTDIAKLLIRGGADATDSQINNAVTNLLYRAAALGDLGEVVNQLRTNPPQANIQVAMEFAVIRGHLEIVNQLLGNRANPYQTFKWVKTLLQRSCLSAKNRAQYQAIRQALVNRLSLRDRIIESDSLHTILIGEQFYRLPQELRERIYHFPDEKLIRSLYAKNLGDVVAALKAGANPHARDTYGNSALSIAQSNPELMQALLLYVSNFDPPKSDNSPIQPFSASDLILKTTLELKR